MRAFLLILTLSSIVFFNSLENNFQYDDKFYIKDNFYIRDLNYVPGAFRHPSYLTVGAPAGHYRPLLFASYALNYYFGGGLNPKAYRLVNLSLHVGSAFIVFLILKVMLGVSSPATSFIALSTALIFAVHPFNSEVVNYISARSSVMSGFFYLMAFWCWVRYRKNPRGKGGLRGIYYIVSLLAFILGMLTKETVITLPVVLWLYDLYFLSNTNSLAGHLKRLIAYLPFIMIIGLAYFAIRIFYWGAFLPHFKRDILTQFYTEMPVLAKFIRLLFMPSGFNVDHYVTIYKGPDLPVITSLLLLILFLFLAVWLYRSVSNLWRVLSFFIFWFFVIMLPTTIMPLNVILQENRGYLAGIVFPLLVGVGLYKLTTSPLSIKRFSRYVYIFPATALVFTLLIYSAVTMHRNVIWKNEITLWEDAVRKSPLSATAHHNLAYAYEEEGKFEIALKEYQRATILDPQHVMSYYNLGRVCRSLGFLEDAIRAYQEVIRMAPGYYKAYNNLALIYIEMGMYDLAIEEFKKAIKARPDYVTAHMNLGRLYEKRGKMSLAVHEFETVIKLTGPGSQQENEAREAAKRLEWIRGKTSGG